MKSSKIILPFVRLVLLIGIIGLIPLAIDQFVLRSIYAYYVEPESTAGTTMLSRYVVDAEYKPDMRNVLVIGDSRIGEGFSPSIANEIGASHGINFVRLGLAGTTPRVWSYVLKEVDPQRSRFAAIYLMAAGYRDEEVYEDFANRALDTAYLAPLLGWRDLFEYPASFTDLKTSDQARLAAAFPESAMHRDLMAFAANPVNRLKKVWLWHRDYPKWLHDYTGRPESMPSEPEPFLSSGPLASLKGRARDELADYFRQVQSVSPNVARAFAYRSKWYGAIASSYSNTATSINIFLIPRGPYHAAMKIPATAAGSLSSLARKQGLVLMPAELGTAYEHPQFFFDHLHLNARGREAFSKTFAASAVEWLSREGGR